MLYPFTQSLSNLCSIHIAYLMWTRRDVTQKCLKERLFDELVGLVLADTQKLPLPKRLKLRVLDSVIPAGKRLLYFVDLWLWKTEPGKSRKWLTGEILFECLVLNADGLINERETAKKILSSRILSKDAGFRLACVNFLEEEVLKLWIHVKQGILSKISVEGTLLFSEFDSYRYILNKKFEVVNGHRSYYERIRQNLLYFPCTTEADEVLYWIGYCLSKEKAIDINEVPHFAGKDVDWHEFAVLQSASYPANIACLDYFTNFSNRKVAYRNEEIIKKNFGPDQYDCDQHSFVFQFMQLGSREKADLFRHHPFKMVYHFLQWPLSQTFLENTEEIWNLVPKQLRICVFAKIFTILLYENPLLNPIIDNRGYLCRYERFENVIHSVEHLRRLWLDLWEISGDSHKLKFLHSIVFKSITHSKGCPEFRSCFEASGLKNKLLQLFLSNAEAVLELYEGKTMKKSLGNIVAKYMPEDFGNLNRNCILLLKTQTKKYRMKKLEEVKLKIYINRYENPRSRFNPVREEFLNFIRKEMM